jgi:hypothetical protein
MLDHPAGSPTASRRFIVEENRAGSAAELHLARLVWGRLVDIYDLDSAGEPRLQHENFVVGRSAVGNGLDVFFETNPVTRRESIVIAYAAGAPQGLFEARLLELEHDLLPIEDRGTEGVGLFSMVPRNAVVVAVFDDLLDPEMVGPDAVRVMTGTPPTQPFEARILIDYNHGDLLRVSGVPVFRPTRLILDPTVSEYEAWAHDPPLAVNGSGFPPSVDVNRANLALRLATRESNATGVERILRNASGHALSTSLNGTIDFASPTVDVLRGMRS